MKWTDMKADGINEAINQPITECGQDWMAGWPERIND